METDPRVIDIRYKKSVKFFIRLFFLGMFFYTTITDPFSWQAVSLLFIFIGSVYLLRSQKIDSSSNKVKEPRTKDILDELYPLVDDKDLYTDVNRQICNYVTYDAADVGSVRRFEVIKNNTECVFSRNAFIWGSKDWNTDLSLEENIFRLLPTFLKFTVLCRQKRIDGFLFELPGKEFGKNVQEFGNAVRRILTVLSDNDPTGVKCMNKSYVGKKGWVFEFNKWTFFITTFAPFYPQTHSRHAFGCENCYILMQPEISFALRDLPPDTPNTNWENPVTVRDRIRIAYKAAGRPYCMKQVFFNPMSWDIVKQVDRDEPVLEWWRA